MDQKVAGEMCLETIKMVDVVFRKGHPLFTLS